MIISILKIIARRFGYKLVPLRQHPKSDKDQTFVISAKSNNPLINQSELARRLGVSQSYVNLILSGKRKSNRYKKLIQEIIQKAA